jgi:pyruvate-formate lyase-activating enzyme
MKCRTFLLLAALTEKSAAYNKIFPRYKMRDRKPTDIGLMRGLKETADKKLDTVILGNI